MSGFPLISIQKNDHVATVLLDSPANRNAISTELARELIAALGEIRSDPGVRALILGSTHESLFCVGADLKERLKFTTADILSQRPVIRAMFQAIRDVEVPTIAAVRGFALGGGCEMALSCDLLIADSTALFALPEARLGLIPGGGGTQLALRKFGSHLAAEMLYSGRRVSASEMAVRGVLNLVSADGEALTDAAKLADDISNSSPHAVRAIKHALRYGADVGLATALEVEDAAWHSAATFPDREEGIRAFNEKRKPDWR